MVRVDRLSGQVIVHNQKAHSGDKEKVFTFDTVFGFDTKQVDLYNETVRPIVEFVLEGYNGTPFKILCVVVESVVAGTVFAYGQTGTGKTYTMEGVRKVPEKCGVIPNSFAHIFGHIAKCEGETQ